MLQLKEKDTAARRQEASSRPGSKRVTEHVNDWVAWSNVKEWIHLPKYEQMTE